MFLNPIIHWTGEAPFLGLFELDFRNGPPEQPLPSTPAGVAALLGIPAAVPSYIYLFDEESGNTVYDYGGSSVNLTRQNDAMIGQLASGLGDGAGNILTARRAAECHSQSTTGNLIAGSPAPFDVANAEDFGFIFVARNPYWNDASDRDLLLSKKDGIADPGYILTVSSNARWFFNCRWDNGTTQGVYLEYVLGDGSYRFGIVHWNAATGRLYSATPWYTQNLAAAGDSITSGVPFAVGGRVAGGSTGGSQVQPIYLAWFKGAAANALGDGTAAAAAFWKLNDDPNGKMGEVTSLGGGSRYQQACIAAVDSPRGVQLHTWGFPQYPFEARSVFSHTSKLGMRFARSYTQQRMLYTDAYENAAWTKSNVTVSSAFADRDDSPRNIREARKVTATADNGYIQGDPTTTGTEWDWGVFVKRHSSMGSDVAGRFQIWNNGTGTEIDGQDFVATSKWQHILLQNVTGVGANDRVRIRIDNNGDSLAVARCYVCGINQANFNFCWNGLVEDYERPKYIRGTSAAAQDWIHAEQGEIEVIFTLDAPLDEPFGRATRAIVQFWDGTGATDRHCLQFTLTQKIRHTIWDNVGGSQVCESGVIADPTGQLIVRARWNHSSGMFTGGSYSELIVNGVKTAGVPNPWNVNGGVLDTCDLGNNFNGDYTNGVIARVRVWATPQP